MNFFTIILKKVLTFLTIGGIIELPKGKKG
nr:MAG TPA: hypothetical protein [Caudoviricetes sp.]